MISKARRRFGPVQLKDGFYIEVCQKGVKTGIKIHSVNKEAMEDSIVKYATYKQVIILGEYKDGIPIKDHAKLWKTRPDLHTMMDSL
jgi:hypothetical protein